MEREFLSVPSYPGFLERLLYRIVFYQECLVVIYLIVLFSVGLVVSTCQ